MAPWIYRVRAALVWHHLDQQRIDLLADEEHAGYCIDRPTSVPAGSMVRFDRTVGESTTWVA